MKAVREKLKKELSELEYELHKRLPKEIQKAREFGDLKENAEYKAAMERQSFVSARIGQLVQRISEVESIDIDDLPRDRAAYGSSVLLFDLDKETEFRYELVTSEEGDPESGKISTASPIGQALMGKEEGDEVKVKAPKGWRNFEIAVLQTIHDKGDK